MVTADNRERFEPTDEAVVPTDLTVDSKQACGLMASGYEPGPRSGLSCPLLPPKARPGRHRVLAGRALPCLPTSADTRLTLLFEQLASGYLASILSCFEATARVLLHPRGSFRHSDLA